MSFTVCLLAPPSPFSEMLRLELTGRCRVLCVAAPPVPPADLTVIDLDAFDGAFAMPISGRRLGYARSVPVGAHFPVLARPFDMEEFLRAVFDGQQDPDFSFSEKERTVRLFGETIRLTEKEAALFSLLVSAGGAPVKKVELAVLFPGKDAENTVAVYIHYLRKKLERSGRKVLFSHPGNGYSFRVM